MSQNQNQPPQPPLVRGGIDGDQADRDVDQYPQPPLSGGSQRVESARDTLAAPRRPHLPAGNQRGGFSPSPDKGRAGEGFASAFIPYNKNLTELARRNRSNPTPAESRIWHEILRIRQLANYKFLRQKPIGGYIVDFYCSELRLVIEIDGDSHAEQVGYDEERTRFLNALGLRVVRYTNDEVLHNLEGVYDDLSRQLLLQTETGGPHR